MENETASVIEYTLGDVFKTVRENVFELSLADIAELLEISAATYFRYEKNNFGKTFQKNIHLKLQNWTKNILNLIKEDNLIVRKNKSFYSNYKISKKIYCKKLYKEMICLLEKSQYSKYAKYYKLNPVDYTNYDELECFMNNTLIYFSGRHDLCLAHNVEPCLRRVIKLSAPFIRKCGVIPIANGEFKLKLSRFELRFTEPNQKFMPFDSMHTLEHFFASLIREETDKLIDVSIMGCRTGFFLIFSEDLPEDKVVGVLYIVLKKIVESTRIPSVSPKECWNYKEHDLDCAKVWATRILEISPEDILVKCDEVQYFWNQ